MPHVKFPTGHQLQRSSQWSVAQDDLFCSGTLVPFPSQPVSAQWTHRGNDVRARGYTRAQHEFPPQKAE